MTDTADIVERLDNLTDEGISQSDRFFLRADAAAEIRKLRTDLAAAVREVDGCVCRGNWRQILKECEHLFGRHYSRDRDGVEFTFYGLVHAEDDYYYGMIARGENRLLSCVGNIEGHGYTLIDQPTAPLDREG